MSPLDARHGSTAGHAAGCRNSCCTVAKLRYDKRRKWELAQGESRKVPALGSVRRVQALRALGWSVPAQALECGLDYRQLYSLERYPTCYRRTHDAIAAMYERLAMVVPPTSTTNEKHAATKTLRTARRHGWPPPLAWDDIDNPAECPRGWRYAEPPRNERYRLLLDLDEQLAGISGACTRLGVSRQALQKWCERNNATDLYRRFAAREEPHYWVNQHAEATA